MRISGLLEQKLSFFSIKTDRVPVLSHIRNPDYFWLPERQDDLVLRPTVSGDYLLTKSGRRIPVRKLLQGAGVALYLREYFPVLVAADGKLLWVPGIRTAQAGWLNPADLEGDEMLTCLQIRFRKGTVHADT
jgi:hypothetical protein